MMLSCPPGLIRKIVTYCSCSLLPAPYVSLLPKNWVTSSFFLQIFTIKTIESLLPPPSRRSRLHYGHPPPTFHAKQLNPYFPLLPKNGITSALVLHHPIILLRDSDGLATLCRHALLHLRQAAFRATRVPRFYYSRGWE
jgi:hypothetical protein